MTIQTDVAINDEIKPYLDEISERLWSGHATVMVGAGFSKNAAPVVGVTNKFPNWDELGEIFFEKVYGKKLSRQDKFLSPLKLAEEVEVLFGRAVLDNLLIDKIPDNLHKPTELFTKLLQLAWRDVFTTNFDTLLERGKDDITDRNYQVVVRKEDIINSKSPRIIKLHGSFPSHTPFIITEEDYRTYPEIFAPFVNTVHQALLETTLCLIGFSGDDPNFLKWIGWIQDQFEENTTCKIYLVGLVNLSESQKKFLNKRNVNIVDLGNCLGVNGDPKNAIERFVDYLTSKKVEENRLYWPDQIYPPDSNADDKITELEKTVANWKITREEFPGWRIVPRENRDLFLFHSQIYEWVDYVSENLYELNLVDIQFVYEYCWQLEKCLLPIWNPIAALAENCLKKYQPSTNFSELEIEFENSPDRNSVKEQWIQISIYLLRYYREEGLHEKWNECESKLSKVLDHLSEEQVAALKYERTLQRFFQLDISGLEACLNAWPTNQSLPFFEAKRAGLLAEIGRLEDAQTILESSLKTVRRKQNLKPVSKDYTDVSDEAYLMLLLQCIKQSSLTTTSEYSEFSTLKQEYSERFNYLHQYRCKPLEELSQFATKLNSPLSEFKKVTQKHSFRIGYVTTTRHFMVTDYDALVAYSFLRFCEDIGLPYRLPGINVAVDSAQGSLARIGIYSPHWALNTLLRTGDMNVVKQIYNRKYVFQMSVEQCDSIIDHLLNTLESDKSRFASETSFYPTKFDAILAKIIPVIFSRLCCKISLKIKERLIDFIVEIYSSKHKSKYDGMDDLVRQLFDAMSNEHQFQSIPKLLNIPIPENIESIIERKFPNPFKHLRNYNAMLECRNSISIPPNRVSYFINNVKSKDQNIRDWAMYNLEYLKQLSLLTKGQTNRFVNVVWSQTDSHGFPCSQSFLKHHWFHFPNSNEINVGLLLENYISNLEFPIQSESLDQGITFGKNQRSMDIANELLGIQKLVQIDPHIYVLWLRKIMSWWESEKKYLQDFREEVVEEFQTRFAYLIVIMSEFILPNLTAISNEKIKDDINLLVNDLDSFGIPTAYIKATSIKLLEQNKKEIKLEIRKQLAESNKYAISDAIRAILLAVKNKNEEFKLDEQRKLIVLVLNAIIWRSNKVINNALDMTSQVVTKFPTLIDSEIEKLALLALKITANFSDPGKEFNNMELEEKLNVRKNSARLAYDIYLFYVKKEQEIPQEILEWKEICASEKEFAEVRIQWKTN